MLAAKAFNSGHVSISTWFAISILCCGVSLEILKHLLRVPSALCLPNASLQRGVCGNTRGVGRGSSGKTQPPATVSGHTQTC